MAWVKSGTVTVANGSATVTGAGTGWYGSLQNGWAFIGPDGRIYEILTVVSATQLTLATNYQGSSAGGQVYAAMPTASLAADLTAALQSLISNYQSVYEKAGAGRFGDGTEGAPGITFDLDRDSGLRRAGSNDVALVTGGADQLRLAGGAASGAAVQSSALDAIAGKLLKRGAYGWGLTTESLHLSPDENLDTMDVNALVRFTATTVGSPNSSAGVALCFRRLAGSGAGFKIQLAMGFNGKLWQRVSNASGWDDWEEFARFGRAGVFPDLDLSGYKISGGVETIADGAVATITPLKKGGRIWIAASAGTDFPLMHLFGSARYDCGGSVLVNMDADASGTHFDTTTGTLSGSTGTAGKLTLSALPNGTLQLENQSGGPADFSYTIGS